MMDLRGRIVVLTGASRGLGVVLARSLAAAGAHLVLVARDAAGLEAVAGAVREAGGQATVLPCDLGDAASLAGLGPAIEAVGPVEAVIHNAGVEVPVAVIDLRADDIDKTIAINLTAPLQLTRALLPGMVARGRGAVVMVSSMSGKSPTPYNAVYTATKHGLVGFTASLRIELAGTGVHAGVVCPGFVAETGMWAETGVKAPAALREVSPAAVVAAVCRVLGGSPQELVTQGPVRPLLALAQLFPALDGTVLRWMGVLGALEERAKVTAGRR